MKNKLIKIWTKCCNSQIKRAKKVHGEYYTYVRYGFAIKNDYIIILSPSPTEKGYNDPDQKFHIFFGYRSDIKNRQYCLGQEIYNSEISKTEYEELIELYFNTKPDLMELINELSE